MQVLHSMNHKANGNQPFSRHTFRVEFQMGGFSAFLFPLGRRVGRLHAPLATPMLFVAGGHGFMNAAGVGPQYLSALPQVQTFHPKGFRLL